MAYDCFISYASADLAYAEILHQRLVAAGFSVWFDKARLREGCDWHREIEDGCEASRVLLPVLTPRWQLSEWTRYETYGAEAIVPVVAEGEWNKIATPPLTRVQALPISLADRTEAHWQTLFDVVRPVIASPAPQKAERIAHLRYLANPFFVGREKSLDDIHERLFTTPTAVLTQGHVAAVTALGGSARPRWRASTPRNSGAATVRCFWVDCRRSLEGEFAAIHDILRPEPEYLALKDSDKALWVRAELGQSERPLRLLILDNAEDEASVAAWTPKTGNCHTIITSRFAHWSPGIETCPVWVLEPGPARELLLRRSGRVVTDEAAECDTLAEKLEYLPLALEQAVAFVTEQGAGIPV